jgi:GNAT superfamily N-acetyltransferase
VLRSGRPWSTAPIPGDDDPYSAHFAVLECSDVTDAHAHGQAPGGLDDATVFAVGTILHEAPSWDADADGAWRVRGMATRAGTRSGGFGSLVLAGLLSHAESHQADLVWCSARIRAVGFYERHGFVPRGAPGRLPGLGEHQTMWRSRP